MRNEFSEQEKSATSHEAVNSRQQVVRGYLQTGLVVVFLLGGMAANSVLKNTKEELNVAAVGDTVVSVSTVSPEVRNVPLRIAETGTIQARNSIQLSPQVSGRVVAVSSNLASGGYFTAGETLFTLDDADYQASLNRALAEQASARADLSVERAEAQVARQEWALVNPGEPVPDLVARVPQIRRAEAALQSAEAAVADAKLDLSRVYFSLPFDGRIVSTTIEVGQNLIAGQSYGRAYNNDNVEAYVSVPADVLDALEPVVGREATVYRRSIDSKAAYNAVVSRVDAELHPQTRQAQLTLRFAQTMPLLPGAFVDVVVSGPLIERAHVIPERAITEHGYVWVVDGGRLARRLPKVYFSVDGKSVTDAFDVADGIVVSQLVAPTSGDAVDVLPQPAQAAGAM